MWEGREWGREEIRRRETNGEEKEKKTERVRSYLETASFLGLSRAGLRLVWATGLCFTNNFVFFFFFVETEYCQQSK